MNTTISEGKTLVHALKEGIQGQVGRTGKIILFPPFTHLASLNELTVGTSIELGAQNCYFEKSGAFTGEISVDMIKETGAGYVLIGHSERRQYFGETDELLAKKVKAVIAGGLTPIFCCGETLEQREAEKHFEVIGKQVENGLKEVATNEFPKVIIAYEPVWAIGTGKTASPEQAQEIHAFIRNIIAGKYGQNSADNVQILYGGSVGAANAQTLFSQPDIDGGLVGGAALKAMDFLQIIAAAN